MDILDFGVKALMGMRIKNLHSAAAVWLSIGLLLSSAAMGQENKRWLSPNGTDPTDIRTRLDAFMGRVDLLSSGYLLEFAASGDLALTRWGSIGVQVPLVYAYFPTSTTFEMGDIKLQAQLALFQKPEGSSFKALGIGAGLFMNTGDVDAGTGFGQHVITPYITASFYPAEGLLLAPLIEQFISLEEDDANRQKHDISFRIVSSYAFEGGVWVTLTPELLIDALGERKNLYTLRSSLGKMMSDNKLGFSADFVWQIAGERRFDYLARISLRYLL